MSANVVFVAGGQCGNQLGYTLLSNIATHLEGTSERFYGEDSDIFFRGQKKRRARCVCLDTEPKAGVSISIYVLQILAS